ncbi:MAG: winged helix-turn-helix transcriptional regulator, partial [Anaerolineales bacterium]|nr:winged helix-turn-helix transcriptional regulator [Anaerolineales bacterium]
MPTTKDLQLLKILSHAERHRILRFLMKQAATLSQLGAVFEQSAAHIRHHLKILEEAGLVAMTSPPPDHNHLEKYYKATADSWLIHHAVLPEYAEHQPNLVFASK